MEIEIEAAIQAGGEVAPEECARAVLQQVCGAQLVEAGCAPGSITFANLRLDGEEWKINGTGIKEDENE